MAAEPPKAPNPRRPTRRPVSVARGDRPEPTAASVRGAYTAPPEPPDSEVEVAAFAGGDTGTQLFQLAEAVRVVRDPRAPPPSAVDGDEPIARAGGGLGWEEPAGRSLPLPVLAPVEQAAPRAPAVRAPVASVGAPQDRRPFAAATVGGLARGGDAPEEEDDAAAPFADEPEPERVTSVRQLVVLAVALIVFLTAGGLAIVALQRTGTFDAPSGAAQANPGAPAAAAGAARDEAIERPEPLPLPVAKATPSTSPSSPPPSSPPPSSAPPSSAPREPERPPKADDDNEAREGSFKTFAGDPSADPRPAPVKPTTPEAPAAEPATKARAPVKGNTLVLTAEKGAGAIKVIVSCPDSGDQREVVTDRGPTTVRGVSSRCDFHLQCVGGGAASAATYLRNRSDAKCEGCNKTRADPICR